MFVVGTGAADIIGEDLEGLCNRIQPDVNAKLVPLLAGGFRGNLNPTWWADLNWVTQTLKSLGIKVQTVFAHNTSFEELEQAGQASANILLSHDTGYKFAKKMHKLFDIPLILADIPLPVGLNNTSRWLRALGSHFRVKAKVEKAFRELGRVVRKEFLLQYISDIQLREQITASNHRSTLVRFHQSGGISDISRSKYISSFRLHTG